MRSDANNLQVLFEDNHLVIINKRPSDIVQGDKTGDVPLSEIIKQYIKKKYNKPGNVFLGVAHRLDRPVSGAVIFARTSKALSRLNEMLREKTVNKLYWAVVRELPGKTQGHLVHYLSKNEKRNTSKAFDEPREGRLKAELAYRLVAKSDNYHLLEVKLFTGRHHQIRVQLSAIGCPVKGDLKYGFSRPNKGGSIHLHARKISFIHPVNKEEITVLADPPADPVWDAFMGIKS